MIKYIRIYHILLLLLCCLSQPYAQELPKNIPDSLQQKTYEELREQIYSIDEEKYPEIMLLYATTFLKKAKAAHDSLNIGRGFLYLSYVGSDSLAYQYADSIIYYTQNSNHKYFPARGYIKKGTYLYKWGDYEQALDNFLIAYEYAQKQQSTSQLMEIRYNIGVIKNSWGSYEEALNIFKENLKAIQQEKNYKTEYENDYLIILHTLYTCFIRMREIDSARYYINKGITESLSLNNTKRYYRFVLSSGIVSYFEEKYHAALDSINKAIPHVKIKENISIAYFYKGKSFHILKQKDSMLYYFKQADSIYQIIKSEFTELREMYQLMAEHYKNNNDVPQQLHYINKLLAIDSILMHNYKDVNKKIVQKYDTPYLMAEKESLIQQLHQDKSRLSQHLFLIIIGAIGLLGGVWGYYRKRQQRFQQRFQQLLNTQEEQVPIQTSSTTAQTLSKAKEVPEAIAQSILEKLTHFEATQGYLEHSISLHGLAKELDTNSAYLSKIINGYKNKNFAAYLNELRVDYAINKLKTDTSFRKYVVKVIAYEVGFKSTESFSKSFYKKTGIYPSYFIKQLQEQENIPTV